MKYQPGLPEKNDNVSHEHPLREFFVLVAGTVAILVGILLVAGLFVDRAVEYIDPELEASIFARFVSGDLADQTAEEQELQALVDQLGACIDVGYPVRVSVTESGELNAYAMPGGQVVVLSAMLDKFETENALAFVLAHELGHFKNRDHLRAMGRSTVWLAVSVLLTGANSDISALLTPVFSVEAATYSRSRESAADALALHALNCHYGHVGGATDFFELLAESDPKGRNLTHYFSSHPDAQTRIRDLQALAESQGYASR